MLKVTQQPVLHLQHTHQACHQLDTLQVASKHLKPTLNSLPKELPKLHPETICHHDEDKFECSKNLIANL